MTIGRKLISNEIQVPLELSGLTVIIVPDLSAALVTSFSVESVGNTKALNSETSLAEPGPKKEILGSDFTFLAYHIHP